MFCLPEPCHIDPLKQRIIETIAFEQEQLGRILKSLADKVETTAGWLPAIPPDEPFNQIVEKVKSLEAVIGDEIEATAEKEKAIEELLEQICACPPFSHKAKHHDHCPCPCALFQVCKLQGQCVLFSHHHAARGSAF